MTWRVDSVNSETCGLIAVTRTVPCGCRVDAVDAVDAVTLVSKGQVYRWCETDELN